VVSYPRRSCATGELIHHLCSQIMRFRRGCLRSHPSFRKHQARFSLFLLSRRRQRMKPHSIVTFSTRSLMYRQRFHSGLGRTCSLCRQRQLRLSKTSGVLLLGFLRASRTVVMARLAGYERGKNHEPGKLVPLVATWFTFDLCFCVESMPVLDADSFIHLAALHYPCCFIHILCTCMPSSRIPDQFLINFWYYRNVKLISHTRRIRITVVIDSIYPSSQDILVRSPGWTATPPKITAIISAYLTTGRLCCASTSRCARQLLSVSIRARRGH
jgi:hypothetical protein